MTIIHCKGWLLLIACIGISLDAFSQDASGTFLAGPKGIVIQMVFDSENHEGLHFNPSEKVNILRASKNGKKFSKVGETSFPSSGAELSARLGMEMGNLMEALNSSTEDELYQKIVSKPIDSLGLYLYSFELQKALGLVYIDETWKPGMHVTYRVEKVNQEGAVLHSMESVMDGKVYPYSQKFLFSEKSATDTSASLLWSYPELIHTGGRFPVMGKLMLKKDLEPSYKEGMISMVSPSNFDEGSNLYFNDIDLQKGEAYSFYTVLTDWAGNEGLPSDTLFMLPVDQGNVNLITSFTATAGEENIELRWKPLLKRAFYAGIEVIKSRSYDSGYVVLDTISAQENHYIDHRILKGSAYYYKIRPLFIVDYKEMASEYAEAMAVIDYTGNEPPPSKPDGLSVEGTMAGIKLKWWVPEEFDIFGYYVLRGTNPQNMEVISSVVQDTMYIDTALAAGYSGQYVYAIYAMNQNQKTSDTSAVVSIDIRQASSIMPPAGVSSAVNGQRVSLAWNDAMAIDDRVKSYLVYRRKKGEEQYNILNVQEKIVEPFYVDILLDNSGEYEYAVGTRDAWGNLSPLSESTIISLSGHSILPPTTLYLRNISDGIEISWPDLYEINGERYNVYKRIDGEESFEKLTTVSPDQPYVDREIIKGVLYEYRISVLKDGKEGEQSIGYTLRR